MPLRIPPTLRQRLFSTSSRARATVPTQFHSYNPMPLNPASAPIGKIGRWYLPTMALIAVGMIYLPIGSYLQSTSSPSRQITLDSANRKIGFAIANALADHNNKQNRELTQEEKNLILMEAYGDRDSLDDMERALNTQQVLTEAEQRNKVLTEAYGERKSLRDVERALEVYEVQ